MVQVGPARVMLSHQRARRYHDVLIEGWFNPCWTGIPCLFVDKGQGKKDLRVLGQEAPVRANY